MVWYNIGRMMTVNVYSISVCFVVKYNRLINEKYILLEILINKKKGCL